MTENDQNKELFEKYLQLRKEHIAEMRKALPDLRIEEEYFRLQSSIHKSRFEIRKTQLEQAHYENTLKNIESEGTAENSNQESLDDDSTNQKA